MLNVFALGNRTAKHLTPKLPNGTPNTALRSSTFYVRDAQGNLMATYTRQGTDATLQLDEQPIYGSSRLGVFRPVANTHDLLRGSRVYEASNHLGNVLLTFSDRKVAQGDGGYKADVTSASDYYAFGMTTLGREFKGEGYRFGFNGKEHEKDVANDDYDFGARIYDARIGRWLSVDKLCAKYPGISPFTFSMNNPVIFTDPNGEKVFPTSQEALDIIKLGLDPEEAKFVSTDKDGYIDVSLLDKGLTTLKPGGNFEALICLAKDEKTVEVIVSDEIEGLNEKGEYIHGQDVALQFGTPANDAQDLWEANKGSRDRSGSVQGKNFEQFKNANGLQDEFSAMGPTGKTNIPLGTKPATDFDKKNSCKNPTFSTNGNYQVYVNKKNWETPSLKKGVVQTMAHELYGHVSAWFDKTPANHGTKLSKGPEATKDNYNEGLENTIIDRRNEAGKNFDKH